MNPNSKVWLTRKKQALELCIKLWEALASSGDDDKLPAIQGMTFHRRPIGGSYFEYPLNDCFACQYADDVATVITAERRKKDRSAKEENYCLHCPMWFPREADKGTGKPYNEYMCEIQEDSPYLLWHTRPKHKESFLEAQDRRKTYAKAVSELAAAHLALTVDALRVLEDSRNKSRKNRDQPTA